MNILDAMDDPKVFGQHFQDRETWHAWAAFLAVAQSLEIAPGTLILSKMALSLSGI